MEWSGGCCQSVRRDGFKFMTRLGSGTEREGDVDAQAHQRISLFEKCLYLHALARSLYLLCVVRTRGDNWKSRPGKWKRRLERRTVDGRDEA